MARPASARPGHLNAALFSWLTGIKTLHVPYRNGGQGTTDLLAGRIAFWIAPIPTRLDQVRAGALRALAVSGNERSPDLPEVPTVKEAGFGDFDASTDYAVFAPSGTPPDIVNKLYAAIKSAVEDDTVKQKLRASGVEPMLMGPADVSAVLKAQTARWTAVIGDAGIKAETRRLALRAGSPQNSRRWRTPKRRPFAVLGCGYSSGG